MSVVTEVGTISLSTTEFEAALGRVPLLVGCHVTAVDCGTRMGPQIHGGRAIYWCRSTCGHHSVDIDVLDRWVWRQVTWHDPQLPTSLDETWRRWHVSRLIASVSVNADGQHIEWLSNDLIPPPVGGARRAAPHPPSPHASQGRAGVRLGVFLVAAGPGEGRIWAFPVLPTSYVSDDGVRNVGDQYFNGVDWRGQITAMGCVGWRGRNVGAGDRQATVVHRRVCDVVSAVPSLGGVGWLAVEARPPMVPGRTDRRASPGVGCRDGTRRLLHPHRGPKWMDAAVVRSAVPRC